MLVYILYAKENWITDELVKEWIANNKEIYTNNLNEATIIWILSNYIIYNIPYNIYKQKKVITTIHHITPWKVDSNGKSHFNTLNDITDVFHSICDKTTTEMEKYFNKPIITIPFWHNEHVWKPVDNIKILRDKYNFKTTDFLIGSFQRDTEGNSISNGKYLPKTEKGPDIFVKAVTLLLKKNTNIKVVLTGYRRQYIMSELKKLNIEYYYFEMCDFKDLNELYNCLDLYIVGSRIEGGPRAINECSLLKIPLISTDVGISSLLCHPKSIFDMNNVETILNCETYIDYNYEQAQKYTINNHMKKFTETVFE